VLAPTCSRPISGVFLYPGFLPRSPGPCSSLFFALRRATFVREQIFLCVFQHILSFFLASLAVLYPFFLLIINDVTFNYMTKLK
jgi:hypothetical protein